MCLESFLLHIICSMQKPSLESVCHMKFGCRQQFHVFIPCLWHLSWIMCSSDKADTAPSFSVVASTISESSASARSATDDAAVTSLSATHRQTSAVTAAHHGSLTCPVWNEWLSCGFQQEHFASALLQLNILSGKTSICRYSVPRPALMQPPWPPSCRPCFLYKKSAQNLALQIDMLLISTSSPGYIFCIPHARPYRLVTRIVYSWLPDALSRQLFACIIDSIADCLLLNIQNILCVVSMIWECLLVDVVLRKIEKLHTHGARSILAYIRIRGCDICR